MPDILNKELNISSQLRQGKRSGRLAGFKDIDLTANKITLNTSEQLSIGAVLRQRYSQPEKNAEEDDEEGNQEIIQDPLYRNNNQPDGEEQLRDKVRRQEGEIKQTMRNLAYIANTKSKAGAVRKGITMGFSLRGQIKEGNFSGSTFYTVLILSLIKDLLDFVALAAAAAAAEATAAAATAATAGAVAVGAGGVAAGSAATGLGLPVAVVAGIVSALSALVAGGMAATVGTLVGSATGMEVFVELINVVVSVLLFIVFFRQTSWLKRFLFKRYVWAWIIEFIPIINYFPTYTFMTIFLKLKINKQNKKREKQAELYGEEAYA
jgi:hypothetical protein